MCAIEMNSFSGLLVAWHRSRQTKNVMWIVMIKVLKSIWMYSGVFIFHGVLDARTLSRARMDAYLLNRWVSMHKTRIVPREKEISNCKRALAWSCHTLRYQSNYLLGNYFIRGRPELCSINLLSTRMDGLYMSSHVVSSSRNQHTGKNKGKMSKFYMVTKEASFWETRMIKNTKIWCASLYLWNSQ